MKISKPTFIIDIEKIQTNINTMCAKAQKHGLQLRPHFKTHCCAEIGNMFKAAGIDKCTVSSVSMAEYFSDNGWTDITIAFPLNPLEISAINGITGKIKLNVILSRPDMADFLEKNLEEKVGVFIEIDPGYGRSGIHYGKLGEIIHLAKKLQSNNKINFRGILTHAGHIYHAESREKILAIQSDTNNKMRFIKDALSHECGNIMCSIGNTPGCTLFDNFDGVDEIRPGNFVFFDTMQYGLGSCGYEQIACIVACPVVEVHREEGKIIIYGGGVHLAKDSIIFNSQRIFGLPVLIDMENKNWSLPPEDSVVSALSQEHGTIKTTNDQLLALKPGDVVGILPIHSCLAAHASKEYYTLKGKRITTMHSC